MLSSAEYKWAEMWVILVCVCVCSPGWADHSAHQLPVSDHLWTLWAPGLPSAGLGLSPYTEEETVFEDLLGFISYLSYCNWETNTLFREKAHNPFCLNFEEGSNSMRALLNQLSTSSVSLILKRQVIYFLNFWPLTPPEVAMTAHSPGNHPWIKQDVASLSAHFLKCLRNPWCLTCVTLVLFASLWGSVCLMDKFILDVTLLKWRDD